MVNVRMLSAATRAQEDAIATILRCWGIMVLHVIATQNMVYNKDSIINALILHQSWYGAYSRA